MIASLLDPKEVNRAQIGPRQMKDPHSREYAIQVLYSLKLCISSRDADEGRVKRELDIIQEYQHWKVLGYSSLDVYLKTETGRTFQEILGEAKKNSIAAVCALARQQGKPEPKAGPGRGNKTRDNDNAFSDRGTDPLYLARRILGADEENGTTLLDQLERGEIKSVRAAAIQAGVIKETPKDRLRMATMKRTWPLLTLEQQGEFLRWISTDDATVAPK